MPQAQYLNIPTWGSALGEFGGSFLDEYRQRQQQQQQEDALSQLMQQIQGLEGDDAIQQIFGARGVPFEQKQTIAQIKSTAQSNARKREEQEEKRSQEASSLEGALDVVNRMRDIRANGRLGVLSRGTQYLPGIGEQVRRDRGEYSQLGKSLISYATNIPIRNRMEFETLAESLYDPNITDAEAEGILDSMEMIIENALQGYKGSPRKTPMRENTFGKEKTKRGGRPDLSSFAR